MCCGLFLALPAALAGFAAGALLPLPSADWLGALLALVAVGAPLSLAALYGAATADADLSLLRRGRHKPGAFAGKVVWITGASQGMGALLAQHLAADGARLVLSSRSVASLEKVARSCSSSDSGGGGSNVAPVVLPLDLVAATPAQLADAARAADGAFGGAFGGVDFLVHVAGASQHALAADTSAEVAEQLLRVNALGAIRLTQAALPHMLRRRKGRVVAVASMAAKVPSPGQAAYSGAKAALWGYFASLATEVADQGVGVTILCPGPVATGSPDAPRAIYGPSGPIARHEVPDSKRMAPARAVQLLADAMAAGVDEAWIAKQPVLLMAYVMQYAPQLGMAVMKRLGPKRARAVSEGRSGYDVAGFMMTAGASGGGGGGGEAAARGGGAAAAAAAEGGGGARKAE